MSTLTKFRVQAGALIFEMEGPQAFVKGQIQRHHGQIQAILKEQARIIKSGQSGQLPQPVPVPARRGRPPKVAAKAPRGRRPGRQPVIVRESRLSLKGGQLKRLKKLLTGLARGGKLGKDATVFAIAYYLCREILHGDSFSAGDVMAAYRQLGAGASIPNPQSVDVVQMLRNLAATSIGKEWVARKADGTFALTAKGKEIGRTGAIVRPRGRRPKAAGAAKTPPARRGRPPKNAAKKVAARPGRKPGRPPKNAAKKAVGRPGRKPGRPRKNAAQDVVVKTGRKPGRPRKNPVQDVAVKTKRKPGRPRKNPVQDAAVKTGRKPGRPRKNPVQTVVVQSGRKRGRPPKIAAANAAVMPGPKVGRPRGRPRKVAV